jgi:hypothetical protein
MSKTVIFRNDLTVMYCLRNDKNLAVLSYKLAVPRQSPIFRFCPMVTKTRTYNMFNDANRGLIYIASKCRMVLNNTFQLEMEWKEMFLA